MTFLLIDDSKFFKLSIKQKILIILNYMCSKIMSHAKKVILFLNDFCGLRFFMKRSLE